MKYAPYFIECGFKKKRFNQKLLNFDIWLDLEIINQMKPDFSMENTVVDFLISPDGRSYPHIYDLHLCHEILFKKPEQQGIQLSIKQVSSFICYTLTNIPVIDALNLALARIRINLFSNFYKGYSFGKDAFFQCIPLHECLAQTI